MNRAARFQSSLRCTAFEELMLDQDAPETPCVICLRLDLSGPLDTARLQQAIQRVQQRHALLRSRLQWRLGKLWWQPTASMPETAMQMHTEPAPAWPVMRYFDLLRESGIQSDLYPSNVQANGSADGNAWVLFLQIHHAITDGLGCWRLVEEIFAQYDSPTSSNTSTLGGESTSRHRFGLSFFQWLSLIAEQRVGLAGVRQFLSRQPEPLSNQDRVRSRSLNVTAQHYRCSIEQTMALKRAAKEQGVTLNDLLASFSFEACDHHRRSRDNYRPEQWLRMMVPINLRDARAARFTLANVVSCVFLDRTGHQIADRWSLLPSIHEEMNLIKRHRLAFLFLFLLWLRKACRFRRPTASLTVEPAERCHTSIVFSNMGRLYDEAFIEVQGNGQDDGRLRSGALTLESCEVLAPVAPWTQMTLMALHYAGRLTLSLRFDSAFIEAAEADRWLGFVVERIASVTSERNQP